MNEPAHFQSKLKNDLYPEEVYTYTPKGKPRRSPEQVELERLRRKTERLEAELERTKTALEITGKVHALLEQLSESADSEKKSKP